jgi:DNA-binding NarL/FixJ family response regulator
MSSQIKLSSLMSQTRTDIDQLGADGDGETDALARAAARTARPRIRTLVVDPDALARRALADSLRCDPRFFVIGQASTGVEALELAHHYAPAIILLASYLPGVDAVTVCERVALSGLPTRVVMLATAPDLELEMRAMRAGASGFVVKSGNIEPICRALTVVASGASIISSELTGVLIDRLRRAPAGGSGTRPVKSPLTDREWEVLDLLCDGASTRDIAETLYLSPETVNSHAKSVLKKLGVHSRAEAVEAASLLRGEALV